MSQLKSNDLAIIFNRRVIANFMISVDLAWRPAIEAAIAAQEVVAGNCDPVDQTCGAFWLNRGFEDPIEPMANLFMPVPRILYATGNPAFLPPDGTTDLERLVNRLEYFNAPAITPGGVIATMPPGAGGPGIPACPIPIREDSDARRFTFVRGFFDTGNNRPALEVVNLGSEQGLDVTIGGSAWRGGFFSRRRAQNNPTHTFTMTLRYNLKYIMPSDNTVHLGPVPFRMENPAPQPTTAGDLPLPADGRFVYAVPRVDATGARIRGAWNLPPTNATREDLAGALFRGQPGDGGTNQPTDVIFESSAATTARYMVFPDDASAQYLLIDLNLVQGADFTAALQTPMARGYVGRLVLVFTKMLKLELIKLGEQTPEIVETDQIGTAIGKSLVRINPMLFQGFNCPGAQAAPASPFTVDLLPLFGPTSLTVPLMPYPTVQSIFARIVTADDVSKGDPGQVNSVRSEMQEFNLTAERYFSHPENADRQSFGIAGTLIEDPNAQNPGAGTDFDDFSVGGPGADLAVGAGELFVREQLTNMQDRIKTEVLKQQPDAAINVSSAIVDDGFEVYADAEGQIETPWPFPNIGWEVEIWITARHRVQKRVLVNGNGAPLDRFGCPIPQGGLDVWGRDVAQGFIDLPAGFAGSNPLGYRAFNNPDNGIDCADNCQPIVRIPPPVINAAGAPVFPPAPPPPCTGTDDVNLFGQASFPEFLPPGGPQGMNAGLKPVFEVLILPPDKQDIEVEQSLDWFAVFASFSLGMLLAVLIPIGGLETSVIVLSLGLTALFLAPLSSTIFNAFIRDQIHAGAAEEGVQNFTPEANPTNFLGLFLVNPAGPTGPAFETQAADLIEKSAIIMRFDVVVTVANLPQGF